MITAATWRAASRQILYGLLLISIAHAHAHASFPHMQETQEAQFEMQSIGLYLDWTYNRVLTIRTNYRCLLPPQSVILILNHIYYRTNRSSPHVQH